MNLVMLSFRDDLKDASSPLQKRKSQFGSSALMCQHCVCVSLCMLWDYKVGLPAQTQKMDLMWLFNVSSPCSSPSPASRFPPSSASPSCSFTLASECQYLSFWQSVSVCKVEIEGEVNVWSNVPFQMKLESNLLCDVKLSLSIQSKAHLHWSFTFELEFEEAQLKLD